jgi:protocatechuate 3,4-dioxygenase beta subunit
MAIIIQNRRDFLKKTIIATTALPLITSCRSDAIAQKAGNDVLDEIRKNARPTGTEGMGAIDFPANVGPKFDLAFEKDGVALMKIGGVVYQADGRTPASNTLIYFYHTDTEGYYGRRSDEHKHGRYRGWMLTRQDGRYAFVTIRPAPYPEQRFAAHIHMTVTTPTATEDSVDSILFEGDRLISSRERADAGKRGGFNPIVSLSKADSGPYSFATRDIRLSA